jgi:hypothetical protein
MSIHLTHVTEEFDLVRSKWSPSLLHVRRKSCTYLALRLTLSPKWFPSLWSIQRKPCTNITSRLAPSLNWPKGAYTWPCHVGVPSGASKMISQRMVCSAETMHPSCAEINTISRQTETSFHLTHTT